MNARSVSYASSAEWLRLIEEARCSANLAGKRTVLLVPTRMKALSVRRMLASCSEGLGITVSTLRDFASSLWSLYGDGREPVSTENRMLLIAEALRAQGKGSGSEPDDVVEDPTADEFLPETPGMIEFLCRAAETALPYVEDTAPLSAHESAAARVLQRYRAALQDANETDYAEMLFSLRGRAELSAYRVLAMAQDDDYSALEQRFLGACHATYLQRELNADDGEARASELAHLLHLVFNRSAQDQAVKATGAVRINLASGPEAQRLSVHHAVSSALQEGCTSINVVLPDPVGQFRFSAPLLQQRGIPCALRSRQPFADTDAGRALLDLCEMTGPDQPDSMLDADYAFNPFTGIWYGTAFFTDKTHRGNRLIDNSEVLTDLAGHSADEVQGVIGLAEEDDLLGAIALLRRWVVARATDEGYLSQQLSALAAAERMCETAQQLRESQRDAVAHLVGTMVPVKARTGDYPAVTFLSMRDASQSAPASIDTVIMAGLNASDYSLKQGEDSLTTLLSKWGLRVQPDIWGNARREFYTALQSARKRVVLQRATHTETADEAQPAAVFEEALSCYRDASLADGGIDEAWGLPVGLVPYAVLDGEERFLANAVGEEAVSGTRETSLERPVIGSITPEARRFIVLPRSYKGTEYPGMDLSASQIESYLECPYQWFAKRRLKLETIDEQFSPVERGTFMHSVLEHFYERFQLEVAPKVTADTMEAARAVMTQVFREQAARQFTDTKLKKGSRYVPVNALEEKQRDKLLDQLLAYLDYEAVLLPAFRPWKTEWAYGDARPFSYAGCNLVGRIDRIDIDDAGNAVVIDYKSSLSPAYRLHIDPEGKDAKKAKADRERARQEYLSANGGLEPPEAEHVLELPPKMQALIYAKAVRDCLNCRVVASIYLNPLDCTIQGAYDALAIGRDQLPFATNADMRAAAVPYEDVRTFDQLIDECEQVVAGKMARLAEGDIAPQPHGEDSCAYCPVGNCPKRLAKRSL